jgi:hypothetical protein
MNWHQLPMMNDLFVPSKLSSNLGIYLILMVMMILQIWKNEMMIVAMVASEASALNERAKCKRRPN